MALSEFDRENLKGILAGEGDWFTAQLLRLIAKSDSINRERLRAVFPEEVRAWQNYMLYGEETSERRKDLP